VNQEVFIIEDSSRASREAWAGAFQSVELSVSIRNDWRSLNFEQVSKRRAGLILANAVPKNEEALRLFRWFRENPPCIPTFAILPPDDEEFLGIAAEVVDDFLLWPVNEGEFQQRLRRLLGHISYTVSDLQERLIGEVGMARIVGKDPAFANVLSSVERFAACDAPVLLTGETGTGKELCARVIHLLSRRRNGPFIPVECGALPDQLFENELFGHSRGAFTDAHADQKGLVALARGGSLFLDEVDGLSNTAQGKLLRLLQEDTFRPLGAEQFAQANIRVIAATNVDLKKLVLNRQFRTDLFYRLDVLRIHLPPLRKRTSDIPALAQSFLDDLCDRRGIARRTLSAAAFRKLEVYDWPGNVRELYNAIQRALFTAAGTEIAAAHIDLFVPRATEDIESATFRAERRRVIERFECDFVRRLLDKHGGNVTRAAMEAGKERRSFGRLAKKYGAGAGPK
jgi:DNA-binding NtrC family response regulator